MHTRIASILVVAAAVLSAQQPAPRDTLLPEDQQDLKLVNLNVIALDNHGQPVNDLTSEDFEITDAGKRQIIAFFRHNNSSLREPPALGKNEFYNRAGLRSPHATVILFDMLNEGFGTRSFAANDIVRNLAPLEASENLFLYILTLDGHLYPVRGLEGSQHQEASSDQGPWTRQIKALMDSAMRSMVHMRPVDIDVAVRVQLTYAALGALGTELSRIAGRKNIVWISDGIPIELGPIRSDTGEFVDFTPMLRRMSHEFDRFGIAIYPVRQVMLGSPDRIGANSGAGETGGAGTGLSSIQTMDQFANITGGRPNAGKDIGAAVKRAMSDLSFSYQIGYYPPQKNWDGKFHKLRVACKRKDVRIQSKTGYYAWNDPQGARTREAIEASITPPFDATEIGLRATMTVDPNQPGAARFLTSIDAKDVGLGREGDQYNGQLRIQVVEYLSGGKIQRSAIVPLDVHYKPQDVDKFLRQGIDYPFTIPIGQQIEKVRVIVFDRGSNSVGSLTIPIKLRSSNP